MEYAKRIELEARVPIKLRVSTYYFRILRFYNHETALLFASGLSLGCLSLYYSSKLLYDHGIKHLPAGPFGLIRLSILGPSESFLFYFCTQLATYGYFIRRQYLVRRKVLSGDYMTVSEYYTWFLEKFPQPSKLEFRLVLFRSPLRIQILFCKIFVGSAENE